MKTFRCSYCEHTVFFENDHCERCGLALGFVPNLMSMLAFDNTSAGSWRVRTRTADLPSAAQTRWKPCYNYASQQVCNWMLRADAPAQLCDSCRYTQIIPALDKPSNRVYWYVMERAKRRLLFSLMQLGLPIVSRADDPQAGLAFQFLEDIDDGEWHQAVVTGHQNGIITLNILEADDAQREARRAALREPYRTLLGHLRHEIGHFYWNQLVYRSQWLPFFRTLFGDERQNYALALQNYYQAGPLAPWQHRYITAYASAHPWEDWAETWAHYMHIADALDTAQHWRVSLAAEPDGAVALDAAGAAGALTSGSRVDGAARAFRDRLVQQWLPLSRFLNSMGRSLGQGDLYPFVMPPAVLDKLCFVDQVVRHAQALHHASAESAPGINPT